MQRLPVRQLFKTALIFAATGVLLACSGSSDNTTADVDSADSANADNQQDSQQVVGSINPDSLPNNSPVNLSVNPTDENNIQSGNADNQLTEILRLPAGGHVSNPEFQWPATENADSYRLVIEDHRGDQIAEHFTALQAGCLDTADACRFTPSVQIHDSILVWRIEAFDSTGERLETNEDVSFNTLRSLSAQPYTSLDTIGAPPNPGHGFPTIEYDNFIALNNDWNAPAANSDDWQQTVSVNRLQNGNAQVVFEYDWLTRSVVDELQVKSYPQVLYGNKLGAHVSGGPDEIGLPATVSELDEFKIEYSYQETGQAERNVAFESFFHTSCEIGGPNFEVDIREYEMMVWIANPQIRTPGSIRAESGVMIDNQLWDVWIKPQQDDKYIAFTAVNEVTSGTLNWNRFVEWTSDWSAANETVYGIKAIDQNWCMAAIEFGVETWWGAARLQLDKLEITRQ